MKEKKYGKSMFTNTLSNNLLHFEWMKIWINKKGVWIQAKYYYLWLLTEYPKKRSMKKEALIDFFYNSVSLNGTAHGFDKRLLSNRKLNNTVEIHLFKMAKHGASKKLSISTSFVYRAVGIAHRTFHINIIRINDFPLFTKCFYIIVFIVC